MAAEVAWPAGNLTRMRKPLAMTVNYTSGTQRGIVTLITVHLSSLGSAATPVFQPGAPLIVLSAGRREPPEFEVSLIQDPGARLGRGRAGDGPEGKNQIGHDGGWLPLTWGNTGIQMGVPRL